MFAIELYRKYLHNSTKGISNKEKAVKLAFEKQKISDIHIYKASFLWGCEAPPGLVYWHVFPC